MLTFNIGLAYFVNVFLDILLSLGAFAGVARKKILGQEQQEHSNSFELTSAEYTHGTTIPTLEECGDRYLGIYDSQQQADRISSQLKVLLVDPTYESRQALKLLLQSTGYHVVTSISGIEGLICLKTGNFDTAFISVDHQGTDGLHCVEQFRAWQKSCQRNEALRPQTASGSELTLKATLLVGVLDSIETNTNCRSDCLDVFVSLPLNKSTISALIFPARSLLFKQRKERTSDESSDGEPSDVEDDEVQSDFKYVFPNRSTDSIGFFSCFSPSCQCAPHLD